jgi:hypothetical protein
MPSKRWIPLVLFLAAALLSYLLSPALSAVFFQPNTALAGETNSSTSLPSPETRLVESGSRAALAAEVQAAIFLPLWEEDYQAYLPFVRR